MACPYFYPVAKLQGVPQPARVPLGSLYHGTCDLGGPADQEACNFGYGRDTCSTFPPQAEADAVRFTALNGRDIYILEKNYSPVRHGDASTLQGTLARQAEVFREWTRK